MRAFVALARTGSFTLTAKELYLSQSAVSHSIKALEQDVGCRLLDRMGKKVLLTQAGEQLLRSAQKILAEMSEARESLQHLGKWGRTRLRIGASTTACQYILPVVLRELKESFPEGLIRVEPGDTTEAIALLREPVAATGIEGRHRAYCSLDGLTEGARATNQTAEHSQRVDLHALSRKQPEILDAGCPRRLLHEPERLAEGDEGLGIIEDGSGQIRAREKPFRGRADAFEDGDDGSQPGCPNERDGGESGKR